MSFPEIPDVSLKLNVTSDEIVNLLLASIAFEELGLANVINTEAEKIQFVLGTLKGAATINPSLNDLERIDNSVDKIMKDVIIKNILLSFKLDNVLSITSDPPAATSTTTTSATTTSTTTTETSATVRDCFTWS